MPPITPINSRFKTADRIGAQRLKAFNAFCDDVLDPPEQNHEDREAARFDRECRKADEMEDAERFEME